MSMNQTPAGERIHIGFFGKRNAGKSSLVNAITGQNLAVVSDTKGTTTDPVYKAMELLPLGPVVIIDTPGLDDEGELGVLRVQKAKQVLRKTDIAIVVVDCTQGITDVEAKLIEELKQLQLPYLIVWNKCDLCTDSLQAELSMLHAGDANVPVETMEENQICVSATDKTGIEELKNRIPKLIPQEKKLLPLVADLIKPMDMVILVVPIDEAAPKGRLILPQQQVIREVLEAGAVSVVVKDTEYEELLKRLLAKPRIVITDSQVFGKISSATPKEILLTSFSILMARRKGFLRTATDAVFQLDDVKTGDRILIAEGCTHHRQCGDIGTVKLPALIRKFTGAEPAFTFCSGTEFPEDLSAYKLILHCGGCMLNDREMQYRMTCATNQQVPFSNYGTAIAHMNGILERSLHALEGTF